MSSPSESTRVAIPEALIPTLADLYDRYVNALDPFSEDTARAEQIFNAQVVLLFDSWPSDIPKPPLNDFRRMIVEKCRRFLKANPVKPPPPI